MRELRRGKSSRFQRRHGVCSMPTRHIPKPLGRRRMRRLSKIPLCTKYGLHCMPIVSTRQGRCSWRGDMQPRDRWQLGSGQQLCNDRMPTWLRVRWWPEMPRPRKGFWVDRSNVKFVSSIHRCSRLSCIGTDDDYGGGDDGMLQLDSCWSLSAFNDSLSKALEANRDDGRCDSDKLLCSEGSTGARKQPTVFCPRAFHDVFFLWRLLILNRLFRSLVLFVLRVV